LRNTSAMQWKIGRAGAFHWFLDLTLFHFRPFFA